MRMSTQNIACSHRQMHSCIHHSVIHYAHITSKQGSRTSDQFIWPILEKKTKAVNAYLIKNSKEEGKKKKKEKEKKIRNKNHSHKQSEGLGGVTWVYKVGLKWPVIAMAITRKPHSVSLPIAVLCYNPSYVTASRCARSFRLKELSDWQDLTVRGRFVPQKSTRERYTLFFFFEYVCPWPRQTKLTVPRVGMAWENVCVQVRCVLWSLIVKNPVQEQILVIFTFFFFLAHYSHLF